jgi:hypothetical protein
MKREGERNSRTESRWRVPISMRVLAIFGSLILASAAAAVFAGLGGFPVAREVIVENGEPVTQLVINPEINTEPTCDDTGGMLKIVTPTFAVIRSMPSVAGASLGVVEQGELVTTLVQNNLGWWSVRLPANCAVSGWVPEDTFETIRINLDALTDTGSQQQPLGGTSGDSGDNTGNSSFGFNGIGGINGSAGLTITQSLTLRMGTVTGGDGLVTTNDDGTRFTIAVESQVGSTFTISMALCNKSNNPLVGQLDLQPALNINVSKADDITGIGRVGQTSWKFNMDSACDDFTPDLIITISIPGNVAPGFGGITGTIRQVAF